MKPNETNEAPKRAWLQIIPLAVPFLVLIPFWDKFPQTVAVHWGIDGRPNGWADKSWGLLVLPCFNLGLAALSAVLPRFDSRLRGCSPEIRASVGRVLNIMGLATTCFLSAMALLIDAIALG